MANQEHLQILKQGVEQWNAWREQHQDVKPELNSIDLYGANLSGTNLSGANLSSANANTAKRSSARYGGANLSGANLRNADLSGARLILADLSDTNLYCANLSGAILNDANLRGADLNEATLGGANLSGADLSNSSLNGAELIETNLTKTNLSGADLSGTQMFRTVFANVDLRETKGLMEIEHQGPSIVQLHTVQLPQDGSAFHFLRGTGIPDEYIDTWRIKMMHPIQYHSLFISHSSKDEMLAHRLHADLQASGVRCWFAPEDLKIGDKFRSRIDEAIHLQDKLLLLLSEHSIASTWVESEVEAALEKEDRESREVLFPIRLDDVVMQTSQAWAATLRRTRHVGDFTKWAEPQAYQSAFERLLRDLRDEKQYKRGN